LELLSRAREQAVFSDFRHRLLTFRFIARTFNQLQEDRHFADYNLTKDLGPAEALAQVTSAEEIFNTWPSIRGQQIAQAYLVSLLVKRG
jgi:hypothetical protein